MYFHGLLSLLICTVLCDSFTLLNRMWIYHCLSNLLLIDTWIVSSVGVMSNVAINILVHIFVYTLFSVGYIPAFLPLKNWGYKIEMLTSQKYSSIWPSDSFFFFWKKVKLTLSLYTPGYLSKINENISPQKPATRIFLTVLFLITPNWKQSKCLSTEEWISKLRLFTQRTPLSRERKYWLMDRDEPRKWLRGGRGQGTCASTHVTFLSSWNPSAETGTDLEKLMGFQGCWKALSC